MLAVTGIALNHTEELKLDSRMIHSKTILDWYKIGSAVQLKSFATQNHWLTQIEQSLYFDQSFLFNNEEQLIGAIETKQFIVTALSQSLIVLSIRGEQIEQIPLSNIERIGLNHHQHIIVESNNEIIYSKDGLLTWHPYQNKSIVWSNISPLPKIIEQSLKTKFRSAILPMERVLLDLHSGRFLGTAGVIIVDICGVFLIILALSGSAIWFRHKIRNFRQSRKSYLNQR
jgi:hypothetical protein